MKRWIGRWLMVVAIIHTVVGVVIGADSLGGMLSDGIINSVGEDMGRCAIAWFLLCGFSLFVMGFFVDWVEVNSNKVLPSGLGWGLLVIIIIGITLFPISGFYLILPPSIALITHRLNTGGN